MKRTEPQQIGAIIDAALGQQNLSDTFNEHKAVYLWTEIVGPGINRYTYRRYVERGVLHVYITSAELKQELSFSRAALAERLNNAVGAPVIKEIRFH